MVPSRVERRMNTATVWAGPERRKREEYRVMLGDQWAHGWLAFETRGEKRRLAPIPDGWEEMTARDLQELLSRAVPVSPGRRLIE